MGALTSQSRECLWEELTVEMVRAVAERERPPELLNEELCYALGV